MKIPVLHGLAAHSVVANWPSIADKSLENTGYVVKNPILSLDLTY